MHEHEARLERLQATEVEAPEGPAEAAPAGDGAGRRRGRPARARSSSGSRSSSSATCLARGAVHRDERRASARSPAPRRAGRHAVGSRPSAATGSGSSGPNGAGKTTLLRTIAGELPPLDGRLIFGNAVQVGYLAQLRGAAIPGATVLDALLAAIPVTAGEARGYLARFLFRGDDVFKEVRLLSGGERSRLELALLGIMPSNLLLLDEPTNHLDIPAREAIEAFLPSTPATMLVVSHDRRLLETVCDAAVGRRRRAGGPVRRRLSRVACGRRRRLDRRWRSSAAEADGAGDRHGSGGSRIAGRRRDARLRRSGAAAAVAAVSSRRRQARGPAARKRSCRRTPTGARRPRSRTT